MCLPSTLWMFFSWGGGKGGGLSLLPQMPGFSSQYVCVQAPGHTETSLPTPTSPSSTDMFPQYLVPKPLQKLLPCSVVWNSPQTSACLCLSPTTARWDNSFQFHCCCPTLLQAESRADWQPHVSSVSAVLSNVSCLRVLMLHSRVTHQPVCLGQRVYPKCGTFSAKQSWENWDNQSPYWGRGSSERERATAARTQRELSDQFKLETSSGTVDSLPPPPE